MDHTELTRRFSAVSTANVADACLRAGVQVRCGHPSISPVIPGARLAGRVLPAQHSGSVDVFLEAFEHAEAGDVLVVDNAGRDEACVGDLVVLEAKAAELMELAENIRAAERAQADLISSGVTLRSQLRFADYLAAREHNPALTFRDHLRAAGGAIEE